MSGWLTQFWVLISLTGLWLIIGVSLFAWGLLWADRSRGRPRCPKCWYDMRGLPSGQPPVCPECGHDAQQVHNLYRNRPIWWPIVLGMAVFICPSIIPLEQLFFWRQEQRVISALKADGAFIGAAPTPPIWIVDHLPAGLERYFFSANFLRWRN